MISDTTFSEIQIGKRFFFNGEMFEKQGDSLAIRISNGGTCVFLAEDQVKATVPGTIYTRVASGEIVESR